MTEVNSDLCNERHKHVLEGRKQDREWILDIEKKNDDRYDAIVKAVFAMLGGIIVNLIAIVFVYVILSSSIK